MGLFADVDLGLFALPAWIAFGAGVLLAFARAPYVVVPTLLFAFVPWILVNLPAEPWSWYPDDLPWPNGLSDLDWIPIVGFLVAGLVIGSIRRPGWFVGYRRRVDAQVKALDAAMEERP